MLGGGWWVVGGYMVLPLIAGGEGAGGGRLARSLSFSSSSSPGASVRPSSGSRWSLPGARIPRIAFPMALQQLVAGSGRGHGGGVGGLGWW